MLGLVTKEFNLLEAWVRDNAQKQQDKLTKNLWEDLSEAEPRWECQEKLDVLATLQEAWEKKLIYVHSLLQRMEDEILGAPAAVSKDDADSIDSRKFKIRGLDGTYDKAKHAFVRWKISNKRCQELFRDKTTITEVKDEETEETEGRRPR